jgi:hypothetical protein
MMVLIVTDEDRTLIDSFDEGRRSASPGNLSLPVSIDTPFHIIPSSPEHFLESELIE